MIKLVNIKNKPTPYYDLYIGRANKWLNLPRSKWANPFHMENEKDRPRVLSLYEDYVRNSPELMESLHELDGHTLGCYCVSEKNPKRCHGHILIELFNEKYPEIKLTEEGINIFNKAINQNDSFGKLTNHISRELPQGN